MFVFYGDLILRLEGMGREEEGLRDGGSEGRISSVREKEKGRSWKVECRRKIGSVRVSRSQCPSRETLVADRGWKRNSRLLGERRVRRRFRKGSKERQG